MMNEFMTWFLIFLNDGCSGCTNVKHDEMYIEIGGGAAGQEPRGKVKAGV